MELDPYLTFAGDCAEAFRFYESCLGGKITMVMTHREAPEGPPTPPGWEDKVLHAEISIGGRRVMGSDRPPDSRETPMGFAISIGIDDVVEAERIFRTLSEKGSVQMPLQETFWALRFAMLHDRFGIPWMINCARKD